MAFTVRQMTDEPIILITYRRPDSTIDEATSEGKKIAYLLREIGDFAYVIIDVSGHQTSYQTLYMTLQDIMRKNSGKMTDPAKSIVMVGLSALCIFHQSEVSSNTSDVFAWTITDDLEQAFEIVREKIHSGDMP